jgi:hypothetical protein
MILIFDATSAAIFTSSAVLEAIECMESAIAIWYLRLAPTIAFQACRALTNMQMFDVGWFLST